MGGSATTRSMRTVSADRGSAATTMAFSAASTSTSTATRRLAALDRSLRGTRCRQRASGGLEGTCATAAAAVAAAATTVVPMTEMERFTFDLKGWVVIPNVLTQKEVAAVSAHVDRFLTDPESLPAHQRSPMAGDAEILIDHPRVLGVLTGTGTHGCLLPITARTSDTTPCAFADVFSTARPRPGACPP